MNYGLWLIIMINIGSLTKASMSDINKRRNCAQGGWNYIGTLKYLLNFFFYRSNTISAKIVYC